MRQASPKVRATRARLGDSQMTCGSIRFDVLMAWLALRAGGAGLARNRMPFSQRRSASQWIASVTFAVISGIFRKISSSALSLNSRRCPARQALRTGSPPWLALMPTVRRSVG